VIFVVAAGNLQSRASRPPWPEKTEDAAMMLAGFGTQDQQITAPSEHVLGIIVGAVSPPGIDGHGHLLVDRVAQEQECPYMVVGAAARDLLLYHVYGIPASRATRDVDFAMAVENWDKFRTLPRALLATGEFAPSPVEHRLFFRTH
jgi:hypothetical protein